MRTSLRQLLTVRAEAQQVAAEEVDGLGHAGQVEVAALEQAAPHEQPEQVGGQGRVLGGEQLAPGKLVHHDGHLVELAAEGLGQLLQALRHQRLELPLGDLEGQGEGRRIDGPGLHRVLPGLLRLAEVLADARQQVVRLGQVGGHGHGAQGVVARLLELHQLEPGHGAQVEEQRGVGRALGALQGLEGASGLALVEADGGVHDAQVGMAAARAQQRIHGRAGLLDLTLVEQVPDAADLRPFGLGQRGVAHRGGPPCAQSSVPSREYLCIRACLRPPGCVAPPRRISRIRLRRRALPDERRRTLGATSYSRDGTLARPAGPRHRRRSDDPGRPGRC